MALPGDLDFNIQFNQNNDPANFNLEDTTDYATLGIDEDNVRGNYTNVTDPLGNVIHSNTDFTAPDVDGTASLLYTGILIPTDVAGDILEGLYSFTYNIKVDDAITAVDQGTPSFTVLGDRAALITAAGTIDIVRSTANNGTFTVVSAVFGGTNTVITVAEAIPSGTADGAIQYSNQTTYSLTKTTTYADTIPAISIEVQTDCFCGSLTSIDTTNYGTATIISRTHTVKYPAALSIADIVSSNATVTVSPIYTKTWTTVITTELSIDLGNGNTITATITGSEETDVECDLTLCDISCCVLALNNRYLDARTENPPLADKYFKDLTRVMQLIDMFQMFNSCDQHDEANSALAEIKRVGNCSDACQCSGDEPSIVIPLCTSGGSSNINITAGTGIVVTTSLVNGNYTYQIGISSSVMAIINSVKPQNVVAGTGISVAESLVAGVQTWTITNTATYTEENRMEFLCRLQYTGATAVTITNSAYLTSGSNINATATVASTSIATGGANNNFRVSAFQVANNNLYKVTAELVIVTRHGVTYNSNFTKPFMVEILTKASGQFDFRFVSMDGSTLTNANMFSTTTDLYVNIKISE